MRFKKKKTRTFGNLLERCAIDFERKFSDQLKGKIEAYAWEVSRDIKPVADLGIFFFKNPQEIKTFKAEVKKVVNNLPFNGKVKLYFEKSPQRWEGKTAYWVGLYKYNWAGRGIKWMLSGKGRKINRKEAHWIFGLLFGLGYSSIEKEKIS